MNIVSKSDTIVLDKCLNWGKCTEEKRDYDEKTGCGDFTILSSDVINI